MKLASRDTEINRLGKENKVLNQLVSKMKETSASSNNHSTETQCEKSLDKRISDRSSIPKGHTRQSSRQDKNSMSKTPATKDEYIVKESKHHYSESIVETIIIHQNKPKKTKANSPYSSLKNRISMERKSDDNRQEIFTNALHARSNSSVALIKPAKNIDSGFKNYNYTTQKAHNKKAVRNDLIKTSST